MSSIFSSTDELRSADPSLSPRGLEAEGVSARQRKMIQDVFANPLEIPPIFKGWLEAYLEPIVKNAIDRSVLRALDGSTTLEALSAYCTADTTLTGSATALPGTTITLPAAGDWLMLGTCDFDVTATGSSVGYCIGNLGVTGGSIVNGGQMIFLTPSTGRSTVSQAYIVRTTVPNGTVNITVSKTGAGGTAVAHQSHSILTAVRLR